MTDAYVPVDMFMIKVLTVACQRDARKVTFANHRAPVWSRISSEAGDEEIYYFGDDNLYLLLSKLLRMSEGRILPFACQFGSKMFRLVYESPEEIVLYSISPTLKEFSSLS